MRLDTYLRRNGIRKARFAAMIGVHESQVSRYCSGHYLPGKKQLEAILRATGGAVRPDDFYHFAADNDAADETAA